MPAGDVGQEASKSLLKRGLYLNKQEGNAEQQSKRIAGQPGALSTAPRALSASKQPGQVQLASSVRAADLAGQRRLSVGTDPLERAQGLQAGITSLVPPAGAQQQPQQQRHQQQPQQMSGLSMLQPHAPALFQHVLQPRDVHMKLPHLNRPAAAQAAQAAGGNGLSQLARNHLAQTGQPQQLQQPSKQQALVHLPKLQQRQQQQQQQQQQLQAEGPALRSQGGSPLPFAEPSGSHSDHSLLQFNQQQRRQLHVQEQDQQQQHQQQHRDPYNDPEVQERTQAWTLLLASMRNHPEAEEFVYLKHARPDALPLNPYDLQVCSHIEANKLPFYFTMSPAGITTYFTNGTQAEFVPLEVWYREFVLHQQLAKLPLFRQYRRWKALAVWRKAVHSIKFKGSADYLVKNLFMLQPVLQEAFLSVRASCLEVERQQLACTVPGQPSTLQQFTEQHAACLQDIQQQLQAVCTEAANTAQSACERSLAALQQQLTGPSTAAATAAAAARRSSAGGSENHRRLSTGGGDSDRKAGNNTSTASAARQVLPGAALEGVHLANDSFALQAAKRTEKRRLSSFVRLLDLMMADSVHSMVVAALQRMLWCLQGHSIAADGSEHSSSSSTPAAQDTGLSAQPLAIQSSRAVLAVQSSRANVHQLITHSAATTPHGSLANTVTGRSSTVVLQLEVLLNDMPDQLYLEPTGQAFIYELDAWLRGVAATAKGMQQLLHHPDIKPYIELPAGSAHYSEDADLSQSLGENYDRLSHSLTSCLHQGLTRVEHFKAGFDIFRDMVVANRQFGRQALEEAVSDGLLDLQGLRGLLLGFQQQLQDVKNIPATVSVGVLEVQLSRLVLALTPSPQHCLSELHALLPKLAASAYSTFINRVRTYKKQLARQPTMPEEFVTHLALIAEVDSNRQPMDREFDTVSSYYSLLEEFGVATPPEEVAAARCMDDEYAALRDMTWAAETAKTSHAQVFLAQLQQHAEDLARQIDQLREMEQGEKFLQDSPDISCRLAEAAEMLAQVREHQATAARITGLLQQYGGDSMDTSALESLAESIELKHLLWETQQTWGATTSEWLQAQFFELDVTAIHEQVERTSWQVRRLEEGLPPNDLVPKLRASLTQWQELLEPVVHLRNPQLRERHWTAVADMLGRPVDRSPGANTTISTLLSMQVLDSKERLAVISNEATQEAALEALLGQVADRWRIVELFVTTFKDLKGVYILGDADNVLQVLEDSKVTMSMIQASRYVGGIKAEVDRLDKQLKTFSDTLQAWLAVQKGWLSLESIFAAPDIQRQLPGEAAAFAQVDRTFKDIMRRAHDRPNALQCGTTPGWYESLRKCIQTLEEVQKGLEDYLETKRVAFARFYFLSNEELLDILRQHKIPQAVQPYLAKCFDGIRLLEFGRATAEGPAQGNDILAMLSAEGERVAFGRTVKARGLVESWLTSVEANMRLTLKALAKKAFKDYSAARRPGWVLSQPAQVAVLASNIHWCQAIERALTGGSVIVTHELEQLQTHCVLQLEELTNLVRGALNDLQRKSVVALITTDVHNRDVVAALVRQQATSVNDFAWQMQLRFQYDADTDGIVVRQVNARFDYGYEYLGAQPRLVVTAMTNRCYLTLTGALNLKLGGAPTGPAGTGKTETVKDLAKALGVQCVVYNCGEGIDHKFMARYFSGLAQCGAWACFDEFNRIELEVLSVVAQQLLELHTALRCGAEKMMFEGREVALISTCGVFVTMNPMYAGRTELPDNLKVLFRPIAMMVPDSQTVAEVVLFSEGFHTAPYLSRKVVHLYKLASEQLSQQAHYDFGMRALKAVLLVGGGLRRSSSIDSDTTEEQLIVQAMLDANMPKLLSEDVILFEAIVDDLFPNTQLPSRGQAEVAEALSDACEQLGLQPEQAFVGKALQLHGTLNAWFGVMLVGPAGTGKTACYSCLRAAQTALGRLQQEQHQHDSAQPGAIFTAPAINPSTANGLMPAANSSTAGEAIMSSYGTAVKACSSTGAAAATNEEAQRTAPYQYQVHTHILNPKSISLQQLYGAYNTVAHEWTDGLAASTIRGAVMDQTPDMHWVVFDGPVDPLWIESMNTVLDDNRMLCLPSAERIKLDDKRLRMLFEVEDLQYASPATVSRCGMVYMPQDMRGWRPLIQSWLERYMAQQYKSDPATRLAAVAAKIHIEPSRMGTGNDGLGGNVNSSSPTADIPSAAAGPVAYEMQQQQQQQTEQAMPQKCPAEMESVKNFIWGLFAEFMDPLLNWITSKGHAVLAAVPIALATAVTVLFERQVDAFRDVSPLDPNLTERQAVLLQYMFAYSAVWGIGGCLDKSSWDGWDQCVREQFDGIANYPGGSGHVFDFYLSVDGQRISFAPWALCVPSFKFQPAQPVYDIMVPTIDTTRYGSLLEACLSVGQAVLLVGGTGVGKSALIKAGIKALNGRQYSGKLERTMVNCSACTSSDAAQGLLEGSLVRRGTSLAPPAEHKLILFVDDINLPEKQQYGAQPPLEMLRLLLDKHGVYERKSSTWRPVLDTTVVAACGPSGGGRQHTSSRLTRHFLTLAVPPASEVAMKGICSAILGGFLGTYFTPDICSCLLRPLADSCVEAFLAASATLLPTPSCSHYTFNFRDVMKVLQGILSIRPAQCGGNAPATLTQLWLHEVQRVFGDRLTTDEDRVWLKQLQQQLLVTKFGWEMQSTAATHADLDVNFGQVANAATSRTLETTISLLQCSQYKGPRSSDMQATHALFEGDEQVLFGNFLNRDPSVGFKDCVYEPLPSILKLSKRLEALLEEYNLSRGRLGDVSTLGGKGSSSGAASRSGARSQPGGSGHKMQLVFFQDAVLHIVRLARVLQQPRGNALLVGVGGSGKQSLARFAAFVAGCELVTVNLRRGYGPPAFREDIKQLYKIAGGEGRSVMLLLSDHHIIHEAMLADINGLLNTGEITGLFSHEEQSILLDQARPWLAAQSDVPEGRQYAWEAFIGRARQHMHVVFATSPAGDAFRTRCRQFPSLVNCTTIDWYSPWPAEALLDVGIRFLELLNLENLPSAAAVAPLLDFKAAAGGSSATTKPGTPPVVQQAAASGLQATEGADGVGLSAGQTTIVRRVAKFCVEAHKSVEAAAAQYVKKLRRHCYITPKLYLDLLHQYAELLNTARTKLGDDRRRLLEGIGKLADTNATLASMEAQLGGLQPLLLEKTASLKTLAERVKHEQDEAERVAAIVGADETAVAARTAECSKLKEEALADLAAVLPALDAAIAALDSLDKADIVEMKTFIKPPALVQLTMEGVCILLQEKTDWDSAKRILSDTKFIQRLIEYDKDNITERVRKELARVVADPSFTPDQVGKQSKAAMSICLWVRAMDTYTTVYRVVEPKRKALAAAQAALDASNVNLHGKRAELRATRDKVAAAQQQLADTHKELASLQCQAELCNRRFGRAGKLTTLLNDELGRWGKGAEDLETELELLVGNALMAAAVVNYLGPFPGPYRAELIPQWLKCCQDLNIPLTIPNFSLSSVLSSPIELLEWNCQGLPTDSHSIDNSLIATRGVRWPLMIDPQDQASRWVRAKEAKGNLVIVRASDPALLQHVEAAIRLGHPLLLEQLGDWTLPSGMDDLFGKQPDKQAGRCTVRLGDADVDYDSNFRLYMVTHLVNPHYLPEAFIRVNLIDFAVTSLEEQLLAELVRAERPQLEESRESLITAISSDTRQLRDLEAKILQMIKDTKGNLLDDESLLATLNTAKATSELSALAPMYEASLGAFMTMYQHCIAAAPLVVTLEKRLQALSGFITSYMHRMVCRGLFDAHKVVFTFLIAAAEQIEKGQVSNREWEYLVGGNSPAITKQTVNSLKSAGGSSAEWPSWLSEVTWAGLLGLEASLPGPFTGLCGAIAGDSNGGHSCWQHLLLEAGLSGFVQIATGEGNSVGRGTPEQDCLLDQLMQAADIGQPPPPQLQAAQQPLQQPVQEQQQQQHAVPQHQHQQTEAQQQGMEQQQQQGVDQQQQPPADSGQATEQQLLSKLTDFQRLLLLRVCRLELFTSAVQHYITTQLGPSYLEPPSTSLAEIYLDSSPYTPIVFVLAPGADALADLARFAAAEHGRAVGRGLQVVSMGRGQGPVAEALVNVAKKSGNWICLQNCHLAKSWMPRLAELVEDLEKSAKSPDTEQQLHPSFRLWLTSTPADCFPQLVLQKGIRIALEPPRGLKPVLAHSYVSLQEGYLAACNGSGRGLEWQRLVFAAAFLHAVIRERRQYGPLGWTIPYHFSDSDLSCALQHIQAVVQDPGQSLGAQRGSHRASMLGAVGLGHATSSTGTVAPSSNDTHRSAWDSMRYIVGEINYGGHVMDVNDRRLLRVIVQQHLQPGVLEQANGEGSISLGSAGDDVSSCLQQIQALPLADGPTAVGLHSNASIALNTKEARNLMSDILAMQPHVAPVAKSTDNTVAATVQSAAGAADTSNGNYVASSISSPVADRRTPQELATARTAATTAAARQTTLEAPSAASAATVAATAARSSDGDMAGRVAEMLTVLPKPMDRAYASILHDPLAPLPGGKLNPLGIVLLQEMGRYNQLLVVVQSSLLELQSALAGLLVLGQDAEASLKALSNQQVPVAWSAASYPSLKPLPSWLADLNRRVEFIRQWLVTGQPHAFWLPGFFFPQGFLTAVLQLHSRTSGTPLDGLTLSYNVMSAAAGPDDQQHEAPALGVYVYGLYLEAARWNNVSGCLAQALPGEVFSPLPAIHLIPHSTGSLDGQLHAVRANDSVADSSHYTTGAAAMAAVHAHGLIQVAEGSSVSSIDDSDGLLGRTIPAAAASMYACPVFRTSARAGALSTTGHMGTNFLMHVALPIPAGSRADSWLLQGVAALCSLDN